MSMDTLYELERELRRLLIAGSGLADGDFRLQRLIPPLRQTGENLPVFARLAALTEELVAAAGDRSAETLLELTNLLYAVLYTQGESGCSGELEPVRVTPVSGCTATLVPYRRLKPIIEALTTKGSGRLEIIRQADEEGLFRDPRLLLPALEALDDSYTEIADLVFAILRRYGEDILPLLQVGFNFGGGKRDARRLELIAAVSGAKSKELYLEGVTQGSVAVKLAAIGALKDVPDAEPILESLTKDRRKEIREAAAAALEAMHPVAGMLKGIASAINQVFKS